MALDGRSYNDILDFYYHGTRLESVPQGTSVMTEVTLSDVRSASSDSGSRASSDASENAFSMSISRSSDKESSASLDGVSNGSATPKAEKSTFSRSTENGVESASEADKSR